jgi:hypothetical protein
MKIWISDTQTSSYRNIKLHCEKHSDFEYVGDLSDDELKQFLLKLQNNIDLEKNIKLLKYYGYLHLFMVK